VLSLPPRLRSFPNPPLIDVFARGFLPDFNMVLVANPDGYAPRRLPLELLHGTSLRSGRLSLLSAFVASPPLSDMAFRFLLNRRLFGVRCYIPRYPRHPRQLVLTPPLVLSGRFAPFFGKARAYRLFQVCWFLLPGRVSFRCNFPRCET